MKKLTENETKTISARQMQALGMMMVNAIPYNMQFNMAQDLILSPKALRKKLLKVMCPEKELKEEADFSKTIVDWQTFYKKHFRRNYDFSQIYVPERPNGEWRLLFIANLSVEVLYKKYREMLRKSESSHTYLERDNRYANFDETITWNERSAIINGPYAIWVEDRVCLVKNFSVEDIVARDIQTETLAEGIIHGMKIFDEGRGTLSVMCSGSRDASRCAPCVSFYIDTTDGLFIRRGFIRDSISVESARVVYS